MAKSIKIDDAIYDWLFDHKDKNHKSISSVIKGLIDDSVGSRSTFRYEAGHEK